MSATSLGMGFLAAIALNVGGTRFAQSATMSALRNGTAFLCDVLQSPICIALAG